MKISIRHLILKKLTGAKSGFESIQLRYRNLWLAEAAAAVKIGRWDGCFTGKSTTNAPFHRTWAISIQMKYVMERESLIY